jgi:hypothetical protein
VKQNTTVKLVTGKVRLSYVNIFTPTAMNESQAPKYSLCILIPKSDKDTINKINAAIEEVKKIGAALWGGTAPFNLKTPLRDGDLERPNYEEYAGHYFINARTTRKPGIFDINRNEIADPTEVYSGCYGRVSLDFYAYNRAGNKGVGVGLNSVMKLEDGEPLGGVRRSADDFNDDSGQNDPNDFLY